MNVLVVLLYLDVLNQFEALTFHGHVDFGKEPKSCTVPDLVNRVNGENL